MRIRTSTLFVSFVAAALAILPALAGAQAPDYVLLKRCTATMDGRIPARGGTWQISVPFCSIQLAGGLGGWTARHSFEFDTFAFCNGPNGYPEYGSGDDICMGRAAALPGQLVYSTVTTAPDAASGVASLTESPTGDYTGGRNISATVNGSFNLTGYSAITLSYYHHHALRWTSSADVGRVEVSSDGGLNWTTLKSHTNYYGDKNQFKRTDLALGAYAGQTIRLRFRFTSDSSSNDDGWFIDDVRLVANGVTLFFDDFEAGTGNWTLDSPWGLSLSAYSYTNLGAVDQNGVYASIPVTTPVSIGEGMGFSCVAATYTEGQAVRTVYAQIYQTAPQFKASPELGYDDLCPFTGTCTPAGVEGAGAPPRRVLLAQNSPNPFNPATDIRFTLPEAAMVSLRVYDEGGRLVRTLIAETMLPAGEHGLSWNGLDAGGQAARSGVYFYELAVGGELHTRKMVLLK
jgi:hypothetical protein